MLPMSVLIFLVVVFCWRIIVRKTYWSNKRVAQTKYGFIFGDNWSHVLRKQSFAEMTQNIYNQFPNARYFGYYHFSEPILIVKDPDLLKKIMVKDFDHFVNHMNFFPEDDPFFSRNLFSQRDQTWREMRLTLTPFFTSSKMKYMFTLFSQISQEFVQYFIDKNEDMIVVELKDIFTRFANDIIANIAFGTECDSLRDPHNLLYLMSKDVTEINGVWKSLKFFGYFIAPKLYRMFNISPFANHAREFFFNLVKNNIENRKKNNIVRPDMINLLLEARENCFPSSRKITDEEITSQAVAFLFAGFESTSSLMCFMGYELGINSDVQTKLTKEIDETVKTHNEITYEAIFGMKYLDMVVTESLRKWSSSIVTNRLCTKPYTIEPVLPNEQPILLEKGTIVWIPVFGLLRDNKYYPDPDCFNPERFSVDNKDKVNPCTFLPFGYGPRSCIGSRFAVLETKVLFFYILSHFEIIPVEKTQTPLKLSRTQMNLTAEEGFWFGLRRRSRI